LPEVIYIMYITLLY